MKTQRLLSALLPAIIAALVGLPAPSAAQCTLSVDASVAQHSECAASGVINVWVSGSPDVVMSDVTINIRNTGGSINQTVIASAYQFNALPGGTYRIIATSYCTTPYYQLAADTVTLVVQSDYVGISYSWRNSRATLRCRPTGLAQLQIYDGKPPYTVTIVSGPDAGARTWTTGASGLVSMDSLRAGTYRFNIADSCQYSRQVSFTIVAVTSDFPYNPYNDYLEGICAASGNCNTIMLSRNFHGGELTAYWDNMGDSYYEVAFTVNGGDTVWMSPGSVDSLVLPYDYKTMRDNNYVVNVHLRIKGCSSVRTNIDRIVAATTLDISPTIDSASCEEYDIAFQLSARNLFCLPYNWIMRDTEADSIVGERTNIRNCWRQVIQHLKYNRNYSLRITDSLGATLYDSLFYNIAAPLMRYSYNVNFCPPDTFNAYYSFSISAPLGIMPIPVGTRIRQLTGPTTIPRPDTILTEPAFSYFPFSTNPAEQLFLPMAPGSYSFEITMCDSTFIIEFEHGDYDVEEFTMVTEESCNGLHVYPIGHFLRNGERISTQYSLIERPTSVSSQTIYGYNVDTVAKTGYFLLPVSGHYVIAQRSSEGYSYCNFDTLHIDYTREVFGLDSLAVYACAVGTMPCFYVKAKNGFAPYTYELHENGVRVATNTTGEFVYGNAVNTYTMHIIDSCGTNFWTDLLIIDLGRGNQAVHGTETVCVGDTIRLSCISLGSTEFRWDGPAGFTTNNQFATIPNASLAHSGSYILTFQPPGCVAPVTQVLNVFVSPLPDLTFDASIADVCQSHSPSIRLNGLQPNYVYRVYTDSSLSSLSAVVTGVTDTLVRLREVLNADTYYYVTVTNQYGCVSASAKQVAVHVIIISFLTPDPLPLYRFNHPYAVQILSDAAGGVYSYTGALPAGLSFNANGTIAGTVPYNNNASDRTITVTVTDRNGCMESKTYVLQTCGLKPTAPFHEIAYCTNDLAVPLQASSPDGFPLYWYDANQTRLDGAPTPVTAIAGQQVYYVSQYNTIRQCEGPLDTIVVIVRPLPLLNFNASAADICYRTSPAIRLELLRSDYTYTIYQDSMRQTPMASVTGTTGTVSHLADVLEYNRNYYITVTDPFGCVSATAKKVAVNVIILEIMPDRLPPYKKFEPYDYSLTTNAASPFFSMTEGALPTGLSLNMSGRLAGVVLASEPCRSAHFTVRVEDRNGCTAMRPYMLYCDYFIPKVFTPNGDGVNDVFMIGYTLTIFDRLGIVIFEGDNGWDGTYLNKPAPPDIYFYKITVENEAQLPEIKTGYIGLERER
ncbi:MAG: putative Ig domain-containing protein [Prevotellaceae bacterium]|jgi:gliding motility-associated-like protein|nr:putative Ig domain-containing protein [Prevotellaceae bacterium]